MNNGEPTEEQWRVLAEQACKEKDSEKLVDLVEQIVKKYDESIKRKSPTPRKGMSLSGRAREIRSYAINAFADV